MKKQEKDGKQSLITSAVRAFVAKQLENLNRLTLDGLTINPFLVRALNYQTPEEVVEFFVNQRLQRSVATAFGSLIEKKVAKLFAESAAIPDIDLKFVRDGKTYYVQMKSGPEGFTGPALKKTIETMARLKREDPQCHTIIAFAYGTSAKISKVWGSMLDSAVKEGKVSEVLVGRAFWEFVLDDPNGYRIVLDLFEKAGAIETTTSAGERRTLDKARGEACERILKEFKTRYGEGSEAIQRMIEDNK